MQAGFRKDIQGLRAVAVILVILSHFGVAALPGGHIGVDVFFVISGYLITGLLIREYQSDNRINLVRFYSRRMKRLAPTMLLVILLSTIATLNLLSEYTLLNQGSSLPYALTWTSNLYFAFMEADYFNELHNMDLFIHTWSLGVEEQFYLLWPLLLLMLPSSYRTHGRLLFSLLLIATLSYLACLFLSYNHPVMGFYMMPARIWQFAIGGMIYLAWANPALKAYLEALSARSRNLLSLLAITAVVLPAFLITKNTVYPGVAALFPTLGAALTILLAHLGYNPVSMALSSAPATWVGDRSYSLYLWHWPIWIIGSQIFAYGAVIDGVILGVFTFILAAISYQYVELPFWKGRYSVWKAHSTPFVTTIFIIAVSTLSAVHLIGTLKNSHINAQIAISVSKDLPAIYGSNAGCDTWYSSAEVKPCMLGENKKGHIVIFGDSIGLQWFSMVPEIFSPSEWQISVFTKSACPIVDEDVFYQRINAMYEVCHEWRDDAIDAIREINADILFIGSSGYYDFTPDQWREGTQRILDTLKPKKTFIIAPVSKLTMNGPTCIANTLSARRSNAISDVYEKCASNMDERIREVTAYLEEVSSQSDDIFVLNLNPIVCPDDRCSAVTSDGIAVYRDIQHLTNTFVISHINEIYSILLKGNLLSEPAKTQE